MLLSSLKTRAFTLIEISIVLVIIGLIVGGILVGRDLISGAMVRSQITQIEKLNTAVNTFRGKYEYLPGDIPDVTAQKYGFAARGAYAGQGDGNGVLEGIAADAAGQNDGAYIGSGENVMIWVDLSVARLVDGGFSTATPTAVPSLSGTSIPLYFPAAKTDAGRGYPSVYTWSAGGSNYFAVASLLTTTAGLLLSWNNTLTTKQAYAIDAKMDDGMPQSGRVMALFYMLGTNYVWSASSGATQMSGLAPVTTAVSASSTTCYDNGGVNGVVPTYSIAQTGNSINCVLSFRFN